MHFFGLAINSDSVPVRSRTMRGVQRPCHPIVVAIFCEQQSAGSQGITSSTSRIYNEVNCRGQIMSLRAIIPMIACALLLPCGAYAQQSPQSIAVTVVDE